MYNINGESADSEKQTPSLHFTPYELWKDI